MAWGLDAFRDLKIGNKDAFPVGRIYIDVFFNNALIYRTVCSSVEARAFLPLPSGPDRTVPRRYDALTRLIHHISRRDFDYDTYLKRASIQISDDPWPTPSY